MPAPIEQRIAALEVAVKGIRTTLNELADLKAQIDWYAECKRMAFEEEAERKNHRHTNGRRDNGWQN